MSEDSSEQEILVANGRFYTALAEADLAAMAELWHHGPETECVHPGWDRLRGWPAIKESWALIFQNQGPLLVKPGDPLVHQRGDMAWVTCNETINSQVGATLQINQMLATNIFEWIEGRWQMVIHHASPAPPGITRARTWHTSLN